jgi:hypothetical protein
MADRIKGMTAEELAYFKNRQEMVAIATIEQQVTQNELLDRIATALEFIVRQSPAFRGDDGK